VVSNLSYYKHFILSSLHPLTHSSMAPLRLPKKSKKMKGTGTVNENHPFGNNPFIYIPGDVDRNPFRLVWLDILFVFQKSYLLPQIILPTWPAVAEELDELAPTMSNMKDLLVTNPFYSFSSICLQFNSLTPISTSSLPIAVEIC
jgi:hypothetical protein